MTLSQGTLVCLTIGVVAIFVAFHNLMIKMIANRRKVIQLPAPAPSADSNPSAQDTFDIESSPEEEQANIEAQIEAQNLDKWCRDFEKQELAQYFRERYIHYETARQLKEYAMMEERRRTILTEFARNKPDVPVQECWPPFVL